MKNTVIITGMAPINDDEQPEEPRSTKFNSNWGVKQEIQGNPQILEEAIIQGTAIMVSNGSFQDQYGSAAWTIKGHNQHH